MQRRRIKLHTVAARICVGQRWRHFGLSRGARLPVPDKACAIPDRGVDHAQSATRPLDSSRFTAPRTLRCHGAIFAAAAFLLPIAAHDGHRTTSRDHHVTVGPLEGEFDADGHCPCRCY